MSAVLDRVRRFIRERDLACRDTSVLVAVSGGPDSVALAYLLRKLEVAGELRVAGVAHFNHQLRASADAEERFVVGIAKAIGWPIAVDREDVGARARRERRSTEDAARTARYEFFERARVQLDADVVAVGHTRDDQAETVLLRLLRGAGLRGLAGMHPRNGTIVRPLLDCRRSELRAYLDACGLSYVTDESNEDVSIPRNRIRAELLPLLERRFNPGIVDVLADEAELAREDWQWMETAAGEVFAVVCHADPVARAWTLDVEPLDRMPLALRRLIVWRAMSQAAGGRTVAFEHVRMALRLFGAGGAAGRVDAPGQRVERVGLYVVLTSRASEAAGRLAPSARENLFRYPLSIPGEVQVLEAGCIVTAEVAPTGVGAAELARSRRSATMALVRRDVCCGPLAVRNRRPGDRFRPVGLRGRKKLQDYFVDRKVARQQRDVVPLVVDRDDRIVWVVGHGIDAEFRVTEPTQTMLILRLKVPGGPA